jgi:hypothetical protein
MEFLTNQLELIKKKFPEQSERIEALYQLSEDFRTLCSDYLLCMKHLHKYKKDVSENKVSLEEYKNIREELEEELSHFIFHA